MNRRGFFTALLGAAAADPERLLWTPGQKLISIPAPSTNRLITPDVVAREILLQLQHNLNVLDHALVYGTGFWKVQPRIGDTIRVHQPPRFVAR